MIRQLTTPDDILLLADLPDGAPEFFGCDRGGWIQFLMTWAVATDEMVEPRVRIWGRIANDNRVHGYVVAGDNRLPPISHNVLGIYAWVASDGDWLKDLLNLVAEWAAEIGAGKVVFNSAIPGLPVESHGFAATVGFERKVD